jgi:signal peptidase I
MFSAFKARRPWPTAAIFILFGPFIGMLFLNRGRLALLYWLAGFLCFACLILFFPATFSSPVYFFAHGLTNMGLIELPVNLVGLFHGITIARRRDMAEHLHWYAHWYVIVGIFAIFLVPLFLARTFLFQPFNVPSTSMAPSLNAGDYFLAKKFAYMHSKPQRGDIIVFNTYESDRHVKFVKRIVGLPGEHIQLIAGKLYIDGAPPILKKLADVDVGCNLGGCLKASELMETLAGAQPHRILQTTTDAPLDNTDVVTVPANSYFVLGDNRDNSADSRTTVGFVSGNDIVGKVAVRYVDGQAHRWAWQTVE